MARFPTPRLDERSYEDIRRELIRRIPVHAPQWTDHNPTDPGIAVLELFAWLTGNLLQRLNEVPENANRQFLDLLQVPRRPARPSEVLLQIRQTSGGTPVVLEHGPTATRTRAAAGKLEFQLSDELVVLPVEGLAVVKAPGPDLGGIEGVEAVLDAVSEHLEADVGAEALTSYQTSPLPDPQGPDLPEATAIGATVDGALWIALLVPEDQADALDPQVLRGRLGGQVLSIGVRVDDVLTGPDDHHRCPDPGTSPPAPKVIWQVSTGGFRDGEVDIEAPLYRRLSIESDRTQGLERSGVVRLRLPPAEDLGHPGAHPDLPAELQGMGQLPPQLDDASVEERVIAWLRCFRKEDPQPVVRWVGLNAVGARQAVTVPAEVLGYGSDEALQEARLSRSPVLEDTVVLEVHEASGAVIWQRVPDLSLSRPDDPHYTLDPLTGVIRFGDGIHGRFPRRGEAIRVRTYQVGGGVAGNVGPAAISKLTRLPAGVSGLEVTNPLAAEGGQDGESIEQAKARIPQVLRHRERAVAADDFRDLALETPGTRIGRVEVLPRHMPFERRDEVPGVVTLVVIPAYDPLHPDEPTPDRDMLRRVCAHLEPRRLVTTELYVTPPEYVPVWVSIAIEVERGYGSSTVQRWVELAIRQFLAPLAPYGPSGAGWPLGRALRSNDVEAAALRVDGVRLVRDVRVEGTEVDASGQRAEVTGTVRLTRWQLVVVRGVTVNDGEAAEAIDREGDRTPPGSGETSPIPVPVVEEVC